MSEKIQGTNSTNYNYYAYDKLGSTLYLTDNNGYVTDKYSYDSWGNLTSQTGTTQQPFKYVGKYGYFAHYMDTTVLPYDVLTTQTLSASSSRLSFLQTGVRTYFPRIGRYMQVDLIKDRFNYLMYGNDSPSIYIDSSGKKAIKKWFKNVLYILFKRCTEGAEEISNYGMDQETKKGIEHNGKPNGGDKLSHCIGGCLLNLEYGQFCSFFVTRYSERFGDQFTDDSRLDTLANIDGYNIAQSGKKNRLFQNRNNRCANYDECMKQCMNKGYKKK